MCLHQVMPLNEQMALIMTFLSTLISYSKSTALHDKGNLFPYFITLYLKSHTSELSMLIQ